jgi:hypothetical protein
MMRALSIPQPWAAMLSMAVWFIEIRSPQSLGR